MVLKHILEVFFLCFLMVFRAAGKCDFEQHSHVLGGFWVVLGGPPEVSLGAVFWEVF